VTVVETLLAGWALLGLIVLMLVVVVARRR
jgi:hypothetical protein